MDGTVGVEQDDHDKLDNPTEAVGSRTRAKQSLIVRYEGNFEGTVPGTDGGCVDNPFRWCDNLSNKRPRGSDLDAEAAE